MEVEVIARERIKPSLPTPPHLKTYKVSLLDQIFPATPVPLVYYYANTQATSLITEVISKRSQSLKQSLAETLTRFYPFAGKVKDVRSIDCNDEGVYYVETRVNCHLLDFLSQPDSRLTRRFLPHDPIKMEEESSTAIGVDVVMVQVNFFQCGGIALTLSTSHKIIDAQTHLTFLKAWAGIAQGSSSEVVRPNFIASSLFPQNSLLSKDPTWTSWPSMFNAIKYVTRRLVFDASALIGLKAKAASSTLVQVPTRVEAVSGLIWKCAMAASKARYGSQRPSIFSLAVNLRRKCLPPLPKGSIGNIIWGVVAQCKPDTGAELHHLVGHIRDAKTKINSNFVQELQGEEGYLKVRESLKELGEVFSNRGADYYACTSLCMAGLYDADFGWGKPIWVSPGGADGNEPAEMNIIFLMDTKLSDGIEAWVTLSEHEMTEFERDPEILAFASLDPSPLKLAIQASRM